MFLKVSFLKTFIIFKIIVFFFDKIPSIQRKYGVITYMTLPVMLLALVQLILEWSFPIGYYDS